MGAHAQARNKILARCIATRHFGDLLSLVDQFIDEGFGTARVVLRDVIADLSQISDGQRRKLTPHLTVCLCFPDPCSAPSAPHEPRVVAAQDH